MFQEGISGCHGITAHTYFVFGLRPKATRTHTPCVALWHCQCRAPQSPKAHSQVCAIPAVLYTHAHPLHMCSFWVTERRVYQERLATELKTAADTTDLEAQVAAKEAAIQATRARILALRSQVGTPLWVACDSAGCWCWSVDCTL